MNIAQKKSLNSCGIKAMPFWFDRKSQPRHHCPAKQIHSHMCHTSVTLYFLVYKFRIVIFAMTAFVLSMSVMFKFSEYTCFIKRDAISHSFLWE